MKAIVTKHMIFLAIISIAFASCINLNKVRLIQGHEELEGTEYPNPRASSYKLNTGDNLYIKVVSTDPATSKFFQTDLPALMNSTYLSMNSYRVDEDGNLTFSFIEKMQVKGKTISETQKLIQESLNQYFKDAHVTVKLASFKVYVIGEAGSGVVNSEKEEMTILQAVAQAANNNSMLGDVRRVKLLRKTMNGTAIHIIDLTSTEVLRSPYYYLEPDDVLYIEPRQGKVFNFSKNFPYPIFISITTTLLAVYVFSKK